MRRRLVTSIGDTTIWLWLTEDAIQPWRYRTWIFPRDPSFELKAGRVLDLYEGFWKGQPLSPGTVSLALTKKPAFRPDVAVTRRRDRNPHRLSRVEHEYKRCGAWAYLAAWDVRRAKVYGRCEAMTGIVPFDRLVDQVMGQLPYNSAPRVFWIVDNGSSHRGEACQRRLKKKWPNLVVFHNPVHGSWLNQVEIYFSVVQRKALTSNDFANLAELQEHLLAPSRTATARSPSLSQWKFTRRDLHNLLDRAG